MILEPLRGSTYSAIMTSDSAITVPEPLVKSSDGVVTIMFQLGLLSIDDFIAASKVTLCFVACWPASTKLQSEKKTSLTNGCDWSKMVPETKSLNGAFSVCNANCWSPVKKGMGVASTLKSFSWPKYIEPPSARNWSINVLFEISWVTSW